MPAPKPGLRQATPAPRQLSRQAPSSAPTACVRCQVNLTRSALGPALTGSRRTLPPQRPSSCGRPRRALPDRATTTHRAGRRGRHALRRSWSRPVGRSWRSVGRVALTILYRSRGGADRAALRNLKLYTRKGDASSGVTTWRKPPASQACASEPRSSSSPCTRNRVCAWAACGSSASNRP